MATRIWRGDAPSVVQVATITVTDTWATGDTAVVTINGKSLSVVVGTDDALAEIATALEEILSGADQTGTGDHTFSSPTPPPEFTLFTAEANGAVVTLTGTSDRPFTVSVSETTAGDGTLAYSVTTSADGPNHWSAANFGGTLPTDTDAVIFRGSSVSCLYNLDQNAVTLASLTIESTFTGQIGLAINYSSDGLFFAEYLERYLKISATLLVIGQGSGGQTNRLQINTGTNATAVKVFGSGGGLEGYGAVRLVGSHSSNSLEVYGGSVDLGAETYSTVAFDSANVSGGTLTCRDNATIDNVNVSGGTVRLTNDSDTIVQEGGSIVIDGGAHADIAIGSGDLSYRSSGTIAALGLNGDAANIDFGDDGSARTITALTFNNGSINDPLQTLTVSAITGFKELRSGLF